MRGSSRSSGCRGSPPAIGLFLDCLEEFGEAGFDVVLAVMIIPWCVQANSVLNAIRVGDVGNFLRAFWSLDWALTVQRGSSWTAAHTGGVEGLHPSTPGERPPSR